MLPQTEFHAVLKAVAHSASADGCRENLNSVLFEFLGDEVRLVATDGHRITVASLNTTLVGAGSFLAPIADIKELLDIFKLKSDKRVSFTVSGDVLIVTNGKATLSVERLSLNYPDYRQILPANDESVEGVARFDSRYITQAISACKNIMQKETGLDIITRGTESLVTLRPVLGSDLEVVKSLNIHIMPMRREG